MANTESSTSESLPTLQEMLPDQRQEYYFHVYSPLEVPIIDLPLRGSTMERNLPRYIAQEARMSFLEFATITMRVHTNFDDFKQRFFISRPEINWTGVIQMFPEQRRELEQLDQVDWTMFKIRLDIATPSKLLCEWHIRAHPHADRPTGMVWKIDMDVLNEEDGEHDPLVMEAVTHAFDELESIVEGKFGLTLADLDDIAKELRVLPVETGDPEDARWMAEVFDFEE